MLPTSNIYFSLFIFLLSIIGYVCSFFPAVAPWFGFCVAGYSVIANDSIQTLGTFISSEKKLSWQLSWLFVGGIMLLTFIYGAWQHQGDLAFGRLQSIPYQVHMPFSLLMAPIILLILTHLRMPVSTTFLLLSAFSRTTVIKQMLYKTLLGYVVAFAVAWLLWTVAHTLCKRHLKSNYDPMRWHALQFFSTALLWSMWIMHDMANIVVFLPRHFSPIVSASALGYLFCMIGLLMYFRGGGIQDIVQEKTDTQDVRAATVIDFIFAFILFVFKEISHFPMSTTWVFLGLLAGREVALNWYGKTHSRYWRLVLLDIARASLGLAISFVVAILV